MIILASMLTGKENKFLKEKDYLVKKTLITNLGLQYELSEENYNQFEKHIILSDSSRAFALRAMSYFLRINLSKSEDKETCKAVLLSCAIGMYSYAPQEATRLLSMTKI